MTCSDCGLLHHRADRSAIRTARRDRQRHLTGSFLARLLSTLPLPATIQLSLLYAVGFGGFVAFSVYLPTYLTVPFEAAPQQRRLNRAVVW